jgi:hypothetical protein
MLALVLSFLASGCSSTVANRNPTGTVFPTVTGRVLDGGTVTLPDDLGDSERPVVLIVAYDQDAQFDVDRWLLGLLQAELDVAIYEVPTVKGLVPGLIADRIDEGMRSGIPEEDWASVVTVYDDAEKIVAFTGNEDPLNARVMLLDDVGRVVWFHDDGYSARLVLELEENLERPVESESAANGEKQK